jgi:signal transduction histidine kinase
VLGAGALSVLLLCLAAASPIADPERAADFEARQEWERACERLDASWQQLLLAGPPAPPSGDVFRWRAPLAAPRRARDAQAEGPMETAFELDLLQATRAELEGRDIERARAWVEEALRLPGVSVERRGRGLLRSVQLALAAGDPPAAAEAYRELCAELDWDVVETELPLRLLAALALAPSLAAPERAELQSELIAAWCAGLPAFAGLEPELVRKGCAVHLREDPGLPALRRALLGLAPCAPDALDAVVEQSAARALLGRIGEGRAGEEARIWGVRSTELGWFAQGPDDSGSGARGFFVDPRACARELEKHARRHDFLEAVWEVAATAVGAAGEGVAVPVLGEGIAFGLRHVAARELGRVERRRALWTRSALLAAALAVALACGATLFTLGRVRALAELRSRFIANVSHDLRTPLASILLMAENLESGRVQDSATAARYYGKIHSEGARLRRMVDEVLDFSAIEHGERPRTLASEFDLAAFAQELRASFADLAQRLGGELEFRCGELPATWFGDTGALRRVFDNLVDNALKHGAGVVRARLELRDGSLAFTVRDHGPGIGAAQRERVFEAFVRLGEGQAGKAPGAGLGLAMARELVHAHGGTLIASSPRTGRGVQFTCLLPRENAASEGAHG